MSRQNKAIPLKFVKSKFYSRNWKWIYCRKHFVVELSQGKENPDHEKQAHDLERPNRDTRLAGQGTIIKAIASRIGKYPATVSKEVQLHATEYSNNLTKTDRICLKLLKAPFF